MDGAVGLIVATALADNLVLTYLLGLCPLIGLSKRLPVAIGVGAATTAVLIVSSALAWVVEWFLPPLLQPARPLLLIAVIACVVQITESLTRLYAPLMHRHLGIFLPLIATNCAVLGGVLIALREAGGRFADTIAIGAGGGLGFWLAIVGLASLRDRIVEAKVPAFLRGAPIMVLCAGLMALTFSAFHP